MVKANTTTKKEVKTPIEKPTDIKTTEIDIERLVAQVSAKLKAEYESKISELEQKLTEKNTQPTETENPIKLENNATATKNKYKFIPDNTKVRLKSNIGGLFTFNEDRGKVRVFFQISNFGQSTTISFEELNLFISTSPSFINKGYVAIVDAYSDTDIEVEDVIRDLRLDNLYFDENKINPMEIESLFDDNLTTEKDFEKKLNNSMEMAETVLEAAHFLYKRGLFTNNNKMNLIRQIFRKPNLFK